MLKQRPPETPADWCMVGVGCVGQLKNNQIIGLVYVTSHVAKLFPTIAMFGVQ